jgi:hypothetical protein
MMLSSYASVVASSGCCRGTIFLLYLQSNTASS